MLLLSASSPEDGRSNTTTGGVLSITKERLLTE
jgi:hypothetical protein